MFRILKHKIIKKINDRVVEAFLNVFGDGGEYRGNKYSVYLFFQDISW